MARRIVILLLIPIIGALSAEPWGITVIFNNDRHGSMTPGKATFINPELPPPLGKLPSEAAIIKHYRASAHERGEGFLYLDQGDIYTGAPVGSLTGGEAIVVAYNAIMPDAVTVGNHEFDDGQGNLEKLIRMSNFPWLGANLIDNRTGKLVEGLKPYIVKRFPMPTGDSLTVGIIGITTKDTKTMSFPENTEGIRLLDEVETANAYAETLRIKYGADFVIASCHMGLPFDAMEAYARLYAQGAQYDEGHYRGINLIEMANKLGGIDVVFGGHIHVGYHEPWEDHETHTLVFQNYAHGTGFGAVRFLFDKGSKVFLGYETLAKDDALVTLFSDEFWPDPEMSALVESLRADSERGLLEPVAMSSGPIPRGDATSNRVGHIVCDAMIEAAGADVSMTNMGGVRAELPSGTITRRDVFSVMPFDNKIVVIPLSGKEVVEVIERMAGKYSGALIGGAEAIYHLETNKIVELRVGGSPVDSSAIYEFATTDYVYYSYGIPQLEAVDRNKVRYTGVLLREAIENWLSVHSPVSPDTDTRWRNMEVE